MNVKLKTSIIIIITLLIGIVIGALGSGMIRKNIYKDRITRFRKPEGFVNRIENIIEPDSIQQVVIRTILLNHHKRIRVVSEQYHVEMKALIDSLKNELKPILTPEQQERLNERLQRRKRLQGGPRDRFSRQPRKE